MAFSNKHITIQDVARAAGVSTGTVSRALNGRYGIKEETRQAILAVVKALNYQPDQAARELSFRQTTRIGFHIHSKRKLSPFFMLFLKHLVQELGAGGYRLEEIPGRPDGLLEYLTDGVILLGAHSDDQRIPYLQKHQIPFVLVGRDQDIRWIAPDDFDGGYQATRHLLRLGHTAIMHLTGSRGVPGEYDRYQGYRAALAEAGLELLPELVLAGDFTTLGAYRTVRKACEEGLNFSAIFAASDEMAIGAIAALEDMQLKVPTDISVIGFDDLPETGESLTTIRQDIALIAHEAIKLLKEGLAGEKVRHRVVPVQLVVRNTTAWKK